MELDEMKLAWQELDARVARNHALNLRLLEDNGTARARRSLRPLWLGQLLQLGIGCALAVCGAVLWATHLHQIDVLVCGVTVHLYGILLACFAARNLWAIHCVDYSESVLAIQRRLAGLRAFKLHVEAPAHLVAGCFLWIPPTWIGVQMGHVDVPVGAFLAWAIGSSCVGLVALLAVAWLLRRTGRQASVENNTAGRSLTRAQMALDEVVRFERE